MSNLYAMTRSQDAIRHLTGAMQDTSGNLLPLPGIYPASTAPIVRQREGQQELATAR